MPTPARPLRIMGGFPSRGERARMASIDGFIALRHGPESRVSKSGDATSSPAGRSWSTFSIAFCSHRDRAGTFAIPQITGNCSSHLRATLPTAGSVVVSPLHSLPDRAVPIKLIH